MPRVFWEYKPAANQRLSPALYAVVGQPCFFTIRAASDVSPFADERMAKIAMKCLLGQRQKSQCQLDVYCVMPDHLHLIVTPAMKGASSLQYVDRFKGWCGREMRVAGWKGAIWQPRSYDHLIRKDEDLLQIADYILANPVRKGLCREPAEYEWGGIPEPIQEWEQVSGNAVSQEIPIVEGEI